MRVPVSLRDRPVRPGRDRRRAPAAPNAFSMPSAQLGRSTSPATASMARLRAVERLPERLQLSRGDLARRPPRQHPPVGVVLAEQQVVEVGARELVRVVEARRDRGQHLIAHLRHLALGNDGCSSMSDSRSRHSWRPSTARSRPPLCPRWSPARPGRRRRSRCAREMSSALRVLVPARSIAATKSDTPRVSRVLVVAARLHGDAEADDRQLLARHHDHLEAVLQRERWTGAAPARRAWAAPARG